MRLQIRTGRVAETIAGALVILGHGSVEILWLLTIDTQFPAHYSVPVLGKGIGQFHTESMQHEIIMVGVGLIQSCRLFADAPPNGDDEKSGNIPASRG